MLIKCPECGKEISNKADCCPNCGFPIDNIKIDETKQCVKCGNDYSRILKEHVLDGINGLWIFHDIAYCDQCENRVDLDNLKSRIAYEQRKNTNAINNQNVAATIRATANVRNSIRCPYCGGLNCQSFIERRIVKPAKIKNRTTLNLNPLKPFTVFNHKQKVVRKEVSQNISRFICNNCGKVF